MKDGYKNVCKKCDLRRRAKTKKPTVYTPETRAANNVHARKSLFKRRYGGTITPEEYDEAVKILNSQCQLCKVPTFRMCIDYRDGEVKGLLCERCKRQVKRWVSVDLDELEQSTTDITIRRVIAYYRHPPGIKELHVQQDRGTG